MLKLRKTRLLALLELRDHILAPSEMLNRLPRIVLVGVALPLHAELRDTALCEPLRDDLLGFVNVLARAAPSNADVGVRLVSRPCGFRTGGATAFGLFGCGPRFPMGWPVRSCTVACAVAAAHVGTFTVTGR